MAKRFNLQRLRRDSFQVTSDQTEKQSAEIVKFLTKCVQGWLQNGQNLTSQ